MTESTPEPDTLVGTCPDCGGWVAMFVMDEHTNYKAEERKLHGEGYNTKVMRTPDVRKSKEPFCKCKKGRTKGSRQ